MTSLCGVTRSNAPASSSIAVFIAVVTSTLSSAAPASLTASSAMASEAISFSMVLGRRFRAFDVGRHRFVGKHRQRLVQRHNLLTFLAEPPDRDRALRGLLLADHEQQRN